MAHYYMDHEWMVTSDTQSLRKSYILREYSMYSVAQCILLKLLIFQKLFISLRIVPTF